jgi:hypothetical protein
MTIFFRCTGILVCALIVGTSSAFAHSSGASFEAIQGPHTIDVGYDPVSIIEDDRVVFDLELWKSESKDQEKREPIAFSRVWTRLEYEGKTVMATGVSKPQYGPTTFMFTAFASGEWVLHVRYEDEKDTIVEASFPFSVGKRSQWGSTFTQGIALVGIIVVVLSALGWIYQKKLRLLMVREKDQHNR